MGYQYHHSCLHFNGKVIVSGGIINTEDILDKTEIIEMNNVNLTIRDGGTVSSVLEAAASIFSRGSILRLEFKGGLYLRAASNTNWPKIGPKIVQQA